MPWIIIFLRRSFEGSLWDQHEFLLFVESLCRIMPHLMFDIPAQAILQISPIFVLLDNLKLSLQFFFGYILLFLAQTHNFLLEIFFHYLKFFASYEVWHIHGKHQHETGTL